MMQTLEAKREGLTRYKVTQQFIAYISQGLTPVYIMEGADLVADPDSWAGWKWNGRESLQFFSERKQYYVDRKTFLSSTQVHD